MAKEFKFLEDIALADAAFEARGDSPAELFMAAAQALIQIMVNPATVRGNWSREISLKDEDLDSLLFEWLSMIVFLKDAEGMILCMTSVTVLGPLASNGWTLDGTIQGEPINLAQHELGTDVKGITKHQFEIKEEDGWWVAKVVVDV